MYDNKLIVPKLRQVWSRMLNSVLIKPLDAERLNNFSIFYLLEMLLTLLLPFLYRFSIVTINFPGILSGLVTTRSVGLWYYGKRLRKEQLFPNKGGNLQGILYTLQFGSIS